MRVRVGSLDFSDHGMVEFRIPKGGKKAKSMFTILDFRRCFFGLFRDTFGKIPYNMVLQRRGVQDHLLQAQGRSIPM